MCANVSMCADKVKYGGKTEQHRVFPKIFLYVIIGMTHS